SPTALPSSGRDPRQQAMSRHAGIGFDADGLAAAAALVDAAPRPVRTTADAQDAALTLVAGAVLAAAAARPESRGCHVRTDHPQPRPEWARSSTVVLDGDGRVRVLAPAPASASVLVSMSVPVEGAA
ncbi:MAG: hypothetical protein ACR2FQ_05870, partial [Pseudonocardiaceae bacterium]